MSDLNRDLKNAHEMLANVETILRQGQHRQTVELADRVGELVQAVAEHRQIYTPRCK
jgi:hypothetical protein